MKGYKGLSSTNSKDQGKVKFPARKLNHAQNKASKLEQKE